MNRTSRRYLFALALTLTVGSVGGGGGLFMPPSSAFADDAVPHGDADAKDESSIPKSASEKQAEALSPSGTSIEAPKIAAPTAVQAALTSTLPLGPSTIADIAQSVAPSVVSIDVDQKAPAMPDFQGAFPFEFFFNGRRVQPNGQPPNGQNNTPGRGGLAPLLPKFHGQNMGSGFVIRPNGYVLTNAHVIKGAEKINVSLNDGRHLPATVVGTDPVTDIALIKVDANDLPVARIGSIKGIRPGDFCIAIGNPLGYDHTVTFGIISALNRDVSTVNRNVRFIQTDAAINPGNSGGPLLNMAGDVIGINTAIHANAMNIGFSIPMDTVKDVIDSLISHKRIDRPWLGIVMEPANEVHLKSLGLAPSTKGVFISNVAQGPAKNAGIVPGDVLQKIDGKDVVTPHEIQDLVHAHKVGDKLNILVLRQNQAKAVVCEVGQYPSDANTGDENYPNIPGLER